MHARSQSVDQSEPPPLYVRKLPVGAELVAGGTATHFRVWAPDSPAVRIVFENGSKEMPLEAEEDGYHSGLTSAAPAGTRYKFRLRDGCYPDPASRFQPEGVHGFSEVIDPWQFGWTDAGWTGVRRRGQVLYELHVGTFTPEGTWAAAARQLPGLVDLGITVIHLMPVGEFPGGFGWGYDGVDLFAPTRLYGRPDDFRAFVNAAHGAGLGVILDVVYNHLGPDGNYLKHFSNDYFTSRYKNEWGEAVNFDGPNSSPVRDFFLANAAYWIQEFHLDGLRLDATQQIFDASANHFMGALSRVAREAGGERAVYLVAENEPQEAKLLRPFEAEGYGLDAMWNDDFHHSTAVALTGRTEAYYVDYRGTPQELISATKRGFLYQGQFYVWQQKARGSPALDIPIEQCIHYLQNHDQVANSLRGWRMHQLASAARCRALTALLLLGPATPMLFQGQEFWASAPFLYFADHTPALAALVARGRADFVRQFPSVQCAGEEILDRPQAQDTFLKCKLDLEERHRHAGVRRLHQDLLRLRREDPALGKPHLDGAVLGDEAFVLRFFGAHQQDRLLLVNLGKDATLSMMAEPLLAPVCGRGWQVHWSSEAPDYGGCGMPPINTQGQWRLTAESAVVLAPGRSDEHRGKENT